MANNTSQLPVEAWYNFIDEPTLADAIMDRLTASTHRMELQGKSLRKKNQSLVYFRPERVVYFPRNIHSKVRPITRGIADPDVLLKLICTEELQQTWGPRGMPLCEYFQLQTSTY